VRSSTTPASIFATAAILDLLGTGCSWDFRGALGGERFDYMTAATFLSKKIRLWILPIGRTKNENSCTL
jgi:hypothetical protein